MQLLRTPIRFLNKYSPISNYLHRYNSQTIPTNINLAKDNQVKEEEPNFLEMVKEYFDIAAKKSGLPLDQLEIIKYTDATLKIHIP